MAVTEVTTVTATCDLCDEDIDTEQSYIDAMAYGAAFHLSCIVDHTAYKPIDVMKALGLDDITMLMTNGTRQKLIYNFT